MTQKEAKFHVVQYLRAWCNSSDSNEVVDGWIASGVFKEADRKILKKAFADYCVKLRAEEKKLKGSNRVNRHTEQSEGMSGANSC